MCHYGRSRRFLRVTLIYVGRKMITVVCLWQREHVGSGQFENLYPYRSARQLFRVFDIRVTINSSNPVRNTTKFSFWNTICKLERRGLWLFNLSLNPFHSIAFSSLSDEIGKAAVRANFKSIATNFNRLTLGIVQISFIFIRSKPTLIVWFFSLLSFYISSYKILDNVEFCSFIIRSNFMKLFKYIYSLII